MPWFIFKRKPKVTRKVVESEEDEETNSLYARIQEMLEGDFPEDDIDDTPGQSVSTPHSLSGSPACDSPKPSTSADMEVDADNVMLVDTSSKNDMDSDFIIPEGVWLFRLVLFNC